MSINFSLFDPFKSTADERRPMPSETLPKEVKRWQLFRKLVQNRTRVTLFRDREELLKLMRGSTHPLQRSYELCSPARAIELNPLYSPETKNFPLWEQIYEAVLALGFGTNKAAPPQIKGAIVMHANNLINKLQNLNIETLDGQVQQFDLAYSNLFKKRLSQAQKLNKLFTKPVPSEVALAEILPAEPEQNPAHPIPD